MPFWKIALACFLILFAVLQISNIRFEMSGFLLGALALVAAILMLFDK